MPRGRPRLSLEVRIARLREQLAILEKQLAELRAQQETEVKGETTI